MKKRNALRLLPLLLVLCMALAACGPKEEPTPNVEQTAKALMESGAYSDDVSIVDLDQDALCELYGLDPATVETATSYTSLSMGAEELTIFCMKDADGAKTAQEALKNRVESQKEALKDYQPEEMPKLDGAIVTQKGRCAILMVAADGAKAQQTLDAQK